MGGGASLTQIPEELIGSQNDGALRLSAQLLRSHTDAKSMMASLRRRSISEEQRGGGPKRKLSSSGLASSRRLSHSLPRITEIPPRLHDLLTKVGMSEQAIMSGGASTSLVEHIFECVGALQYIIRSSQENIISSVSGERDDDTQSALDLNSRSMGKLMHEIVALYGLCGDTLRVLSDSEPNAATVEDQFGRLPLHVAVDRDNPWMQTIQDLTNAYPEALDCRDGSGRLPLHIAVDRQEPSLEVVSYLVANNPESASARRGVGRLPIHYACFPDVPNLGVVKCLNAAFPLGARICDVYGRLPLHYSVEKQYPQERLVTLLLDEYPEGASVRDSYNRVPLAIAVENTANNSHRIVRALYNAYPDAIRLVGLNGKLPLQIATEHFAPCQLCVSFLANKYPEAILLAAGSASVGGGGGGGVGGGTKHANPSLSPIDTAMRNNAWATVRTLLMVIPQHNPQLLRDLHWRARKVALLLALYRRPEPETEANPSSGRTSPELPRASPLPIALPLAKTKEKLGLGRGGGDRSIEGSSNGAITPRGSITAEATTVELATVEGLAIVDSQEQQKSPPKQEFVAPYVVQLSAQHLLLSVGLSGLQPNSSAGLPLSARREGRERSHSMHSLGGRSDTESSLPGPTARRESSKPQQNLYLRLYQTNMEAFKLAVRYL